MSQINLDQKFEILKIEISLIQATLDKYDDLIFRGRNSFITLWLAALGLSFTIKSEVMPLLVVVISAVYWILEGVMRYQYWFKYVDRYRFLRNNINSPNFELSSTPVYDLTNHIKRNPTSSWSRFKACFLKREPILLYGLMGGMSLGLWFLLRNGIVSFPN